MALRDILVHADSSRSMPERVRLAAELASAHEAHLTGLYVIEIPVLPSYAEAQIPAEIFEAQRAAFVAAAAASKHVFSEITSKVGVGAEWRCVEDQRLAALSLHAYYADLLVVGQFDASDPECVSRGLADRLALESGRPVLVVPARGASSAVGRNVLVAWNAKREAVRAISDAMPLLERADRVTVVTVNPASEDPENAGIPAADIGLHLARHGIDTTAKSVYGAPAAVGQLLLEAASDVGADLVIMGAYGHSRFREVVLGGVTAHILSHAAVPVLIAH